MFAENLFKDKYVLVTGGRSGIGFEITRQFLHYGAKAFICSRKEDALNQSAEALRKYGTCHAVVCDIRNTADIERLTDEIQSTFGRLDVLVNNAGGQFPAPADLISEKGWAAVINNNLNGTFYMSQSIAKSFFIPQQSGIIVNITANVLRGFPGMAHTGAARAGVENLTKTLAQEWATHNIRVNAIAPGTIESSGLDQYPLEIRQQFDKGRKANLLGRFGKVEDVANAVLFMSSPLASYISGIILPVDGCEHLSGDRMALLDTLRKMMET